MTQYIEYGIDLGTTNSCIAKCEGSDVRVFQNNAQMNVTPSVIHITKGNRLIVGRRAYESMLTDPENTQAEFKRWMGKGDQKLFPASGRTMRAGEMSAEILKSLREDVRRLAGVEVTAAVVTVPATFGTAQCDATSRAARLAGLEHAPLMQEPIAAAVAYGITPGARDQQWLVFDLGGGTLDIAVVSTRGGRLTVLEHSGDRLLGGKDIDRLIVQRFLLPQLGEMFALPDPIGEPELHASLVRRLARIAETVKIELSTTTEAVAEVFDVGEDVDGQVIEASVPLRRSDLEQAVEPMFDRCFVLAEEALARANLRGMDLDRVLLVGGPTQMPVLRAAIADRFGARVDHSLDPMTVVARGAAIYAASLERHVEAGAQSQPAAGTLRARLAFDPVSPLLQAIVEGVLEGDGAALAREVRIDAEGQFWTSGWIPVSSHGFEVKVNLLDGRSTRFWLYARGSQGRLLDVQDGEFAIRHGLAVSAPPLPHTISVEVVRSDGRTELQPIFARSMPLPARATHTFRANHTVRPSEPGTHIAIKLWEGEQLGDPEANHWVGKMLISADDIRRPIPEGSEIELTIEIDTSRLITVEAFVPRLNLPLSGQIYAADRDQEITTDVLGTLDRQVEAHASRLEELQEAAASAEDEALREEVEALKSRVEALDIQANQLSPAEATDPDSVQRLDEESRDIRRKLGALEAKLGSHRLATMDAEEASSDTEEVVQAFGSALEKSELAMLKRELDRAVTNADERGIRKAAEALSSLRWRVLFAQDWFWRELFDSLRQPGRAFKHLAEARRWIQDGEQALATNDGERLRNAVRRLRLLDASNKAQEDRERALRSGLRRR